MNERIDVAASIEATPELIAGMFWGLDSAQQADFFAELERIAGVKLCMQMAWVVNEIAERAENGQRDAMHGFQTMLSHAQEYADGAAHWRTARAKGEISRMGKQA